MSSNEQDQQAKEKALWVCFFLQISKQPYIAQPGLCMQLGFGKSPGDTVNRRFYILDLLHSLFKVACGITLAVNLFGSLEGVQMQVPAALNNYQWSVQLYPDTETWMQHGPVQSLLFWFVLELTAMLLRHSGTFAHIKSLHSMLSIKKDKQDSRPEKEANNPTKLDVIFSRVLSSAATVALMSGNTFNTDNADHADDSDDAGDADDPDDPRNPGDPATFRSKMAEVDVEKAERMLQCKSRVYSTGSQIAIVSIYIVIVALVLLYFASRNLFVLLPVSWGHADTQKPEETTVSVILVCLISLVMIECVMRLFIALLFYGVPMWSIGWLLRPLCLLAGLVIIWVSDTWLDTEDKRNINMYSNIKRVRFVVFFFFLVAGASHMFHIYVLWQQGRQRKGDKSYDLHNRNKAELICMCLVHLVPLGIAMYFLVEWDTGISQCDGECLAPSMHWFATEGLSTYNQTYIGPIDQQSTDLYNKTMAACKQAGAHIASLGEHCRFANKIIILFVVSFLLDAVASSVFNLLLFQQCLKEISMATDKTKKKQKTKP